MCRPVDLAYAKTVSVSRAFDGYTYAGSMRCERGDCPERATHLVYIRFPDAPEEIWRVCRAHDRDLKLAFPRGRPRPEQIEEPSSSPRVHCRQCDQPLDEAVADARDEVSHPCPYCGSLKRHIRVRHRCRYEAPACLVSCGFCGGGSFCLQVRLRSRFGVVPAQLGIAGEPEVAWAGYRDPDGLP